MYHWKCQCLHWNGCFNHFPYIKTSTTNIMISHQRLSRVCCFVVNVCVVHSTDSIQRFSYIVFVSQIGRIYTDVLRCLPLLFIPFSCTTSISCANIGHQKRSVKLNIPKTVKTTLIFFFWSLYRLSNQFQRQNHILIGF